MSIEWRSEPGKPYTLPAIWSLDLDDAELRRMALALAPTQNDLARAARRPPLEREAVLVRRGLVRLCVAAALDARAADISILWSEKGAPLLGPPFGEFRLSWAQRKNRFACALARQPIGVDVEIPDGGEIPWNALDASEAQTLRALGPAERDLQFLRIWAAKEAYGKALGEGLRREPSEFAVHFVNQGDAYISDRAAGVRSAARIVLATLADEAVIAVALIDGGAGSAA
jgi:4'-phosphopantetheinyl transferase